MIMYYKTAATPDESIANRIVEQIDQPQFWSVNAGSILLYTFAASRFLRWKSYCPSIRFITAIKLQLHFSFPV